MNLKKIKKAKTKFLGKEIIYKETLNSTQDLAKDLGKDNIRINAITGEVIHVDNGFSTVGV